MEPTVIFKCLSDHTRLTCMLLLIKEAELCVCELTAALQESQPKISRHLAQLKNCGLIEDRRQGQWVFYRLSPELPAWVANTLNQLVSDQQALTAPFLGHLEKMGPRPERLSICQQEL